MACPRQPIAGVPMACAKRHPCRQCQSKAEEERQAYLSNLAQGFSFWETKTGTGCQWHKLGPAYSRIRTYVKSRGEQEEASANEDNS